MTGFTPRKGGSVASKLPDPARRYEIADKLYEELITWCAYHAKQGPDAPGSDQAAVDNYNRLVTQYTAERKALDPEDRAAIDAVIVEHTEVVRSFWVGSRGYPDWLRW
jgi:hypothetical protein